MISLKPPKHKNDAIRIAKFKGRNRYVYLYPEDTETHMTACKEERDKLFKQHLESDRKLSRQAIDAMCGYYERDLETAPEPELSRKYEEAKKFADNDVRKWLKFDDEMELEPVLNGRVVNYVSGPSGCGKSYLIARNVANHLPPARVRDEDDDPDDPDREPDPGIFLFSPLPSEEMKKIIEKAKGEIIHINMEEFEEECGRRFMAEDVPRDSVVIFDDIESYPDDRDGEGPRGPIKIPVKRRYTKMRDTILERGRHQNIDVHTVSHNPMNGHETKASLREAPHWTIYPGAAPVDAAKILDKKARWPQGLINRILDLKLPARVPKGGKKEGWVWIHKDVPAYGVWQHGVFCV